MATGAKRHFEVHEQSPEGDETPMGGDETPFGDGEFDDVDAEEDTQEVGTFISCS